MLKGSAPPNERSERGLVRAIGVWGLAASIVNVTVGGGIFRLPASPEIAGRLGAAAPLAYLLCAAAMGLIVVCIAQAAQRVSLTGGPDPLYLGLGDTIPCYGKILQIRQEGAKWVVLTDRDKIVQR